MDCNVRFCQERISTSYSSQPLNPVYFRNYRQTSKRGWHCRASTLNTALLKIIIPIKNYLLQRDYIYIYIPGHNKFSYGSIRYFLRIERLLNFTDYVQEHSPYN